MEREEQMYKDWEENIANSYDEEVDDTCFSAFLDGVNWADANPQFSKEKFIEKAVNWLVTNASDYAISTTGDDDDCVVSLDMVEDFKKAMEE